RIYDPDSATPIADEKMRERFETKRDADMREIVERIRRLDVERAYRVAGQLEQAAARIRDLLVPRIKSANRAFRRRVARIEAAVFGVVLVALLAISIGLDWWDGIRFAPPWLD